MHIVSAELNLTLEATFMALTFNAESIIILVKESQPGPLGHTLLCSKLPPIAVATLSGCVLNKGL